MGLGGEVGKETTKKEMIEVFLWRHTWHFPHFLKIVNLWLHRYGDTKKSSFIVKSIKLTINLIFVNVVIILVLVFLYY